MRRILIVTTLGMILMVGIQVLGSETEDDIQDHQFRHGDLLCDKCRPGEFMVRECTETTPTQCRACGDNEYTEHYNIVKECLRCTDCTKLHERVLLECTPVTDRQCTCEDGFFLSGAFCFTHRKCPKGYGVKRKGTPLRNTICQRCKSGTFSNVESSLAPCRNHTDCGTMGLCVTRRGDRRRDNLCGNCTSLSSNKTAATQTVIKPSESTEHIVTTLSMNDENVTVTTNMTAHIGSAMTWGPGIYIMIVLIVIIVIIAVGFGCAIAAKKWWYLRRPSGVQTNSGTPWRQAFTMVFTQPGNNAKRSPPINNAANDRTQDPLLSVLAPDGRVISQLVHPPRPRLRRLVSRTSETGTTDTRLNQMTPELRHRPVSLPELQAISDHVGGVWMELGRLLGFSDGQVDCFSHDYQRLSERVYQMLRTWKEKLSDRATVGVLVDALIAVRKPDVALTLVIEEANNERERETE